MTKTKHKQLSARAHKVCLTALRKLAKDHGLKVQYVGGDSIVGKLTKAAFAIGENVGMGMHVRAKWVIMGRNGYLSSRPHGEDCHTMLIRLNDGPGYGSVKEWEEFIADHGNCLAFVNFGHGHFLGSDNFDPTNTKEVENLLSLLEINKDSCKWGRENA
jgi:hypothetical protein